MSIRTLISTLALGATLAAALALPVHAQEPATAPALASSHTAAAVPATPAVTEPDAANVPYWRGVPESGTQKGVSTLPGTEKGVLIQSFTQYPAVPLTNAGEAWRRVRNIWLVPYGGALLVITVLALALYFFTKGPIGTHTPYTGKVIERFTYFERAAHWANAIAFCVLAVSGVVIAFGKFTLLPLIGHELFGPLTYALKTAHNFAGPLFAVSLAIVFFTFLRDNIPALVDIQWLLKGGGLFGGHEPPSGRFNAGEKIVFWGGVFWLGMVVVGSGLVLDKLLPGLDYERGTMQIAEMVHATATILMMCMFIAHIYLGSIGMTDAYKAMKTGYVDEGWARDHHGLWLDDIDAGKVPAQRTPPEQRASQPAGTVLKT